MVTTAADVQGIPQFERFFRAAAGLDVDKSDLRRFNDFVGDQIHDLLIRAQANATANVRDVILPQDLPITKGMQERMHEFRRLNEEIDLMPILDRIATYPQLDKAVGDETRAELPWIAGGLGVGLAHAFKVIDPELKNPQTAQWERVFRLFRLLM